MANGKDESNLGLPSVFLSQPTSHPQFHPQQLAFNLQEQASALTQHKKSAVRSSLYSAIKKCK